MNKNKNIPVVWQLTVVHFNEKTLIRGVLLKTHPSVYKTPTSWFSNLKQVIQSYFAKIDSGRPISIIADTQSILTKTDEHGGFSIIVNFLVNDIRILVAESEQPLRIVQPYPIIFERTKSTYDVISDLDDTVLISHTADILKRIGTLAFTAPQKRKTIAFTQRILKAFSQYEARVHYVSKSEYNLFGLLSSFITHKKLPQGPLLLTPYLSFSQLLHSKKGYDFKLNQIRTILENTKDKRFILLGDDSQKDMEVYTKIINEFPEKILKVYIRQTKAKILLRQKTDWEKLTSTGVPAVYFTDETPFDNQEIINLLKR